MGAVLSVGWSWGGCLDVPKPFGFAIRADTETGERLVDLAVPFGDATMMESASYGQWSKEITVPDGERMIVSIVTVGFDGKESEPVSQEFDVPANPDGGEQTSETTQWTSAPPPPPTNLSVVFVRFTE